MQISSVAIGIVLLLGAFLCGFPAVAQTTSGAIAGTVTEPGGEPLSAVVVQVRSNDTGVVRSVVTDDRGRFRIDSLTPGRWTAAVRFQDGTVSESRILELRLQQTTHVEFSASPTASETVKVTADALMDPRNTSETVSFSQEQISGLPLSGRSFTDLAKLDSSVGGAPVGLFFGEREAAFVVNGQSGRSNSFLVDGLDNNDPVSSTNLNAFYSQQVIREFTLMTDQYAPEFGRASGGILNIVTRQGGNRFGWSAFAQGSGDDWNSPGEFVESLPDTGGAQNSLSRMAAGFNFGGPIKKDRAFYFVAFERQDQNRVSPYTGVDREGRVGGTLLSRSENNNLFFRTDLIIGAKHELMMRLTYDQRDEDGANVGGVHTPENGFTFDEEDLGFAATLKSFVSGRTINEFRMLAATSRFDQRANSSLAEVSRPSGIFGGNPLALQERDETRFQLVNNVTMTRGTHTMKFGVDAAWSRIDLVAEFNPQGQVNYDTDTAFDPDLIETYPLVYVRVDGSPRDTFDDTRLALFGQDSWDVSARVHLNYGLRYDLSTFRLDENARVDSVVPNGGASRDYDNLAPRFGFSWKARGNGSMIVRGGAGIFYDKLVLGFPAVAAVTSHTRFNIVFPQDIPSLAFEINRRREPLEDLLQDEEFVNGALDVTLDDVEKLSMRFSTATELDTPYTVQYNLGLDLATGRRSALRFNATRSLGYNLPLMLDLNPVSGVVPFGLECNAQNLDLGAQLEVPCHLADREVGSITSITSEGRSWYWAFDTKWRWNADDGSWFSASYTLSRAENTGFDPLKNGISIPPDSTDLSGERARSDSDRRHRFVLSGDMGFSPLGLRASGVAQFSTGVPFNVTSGTDENLDGFLTDRPEGIRRNSGEDTPLDALNAFRAAEGLDPVVSLEEPNFFQVDLRIYKRFPFNRERGTGEVFLQVFNLFDRQNVGLIEGRATARNFGEVVALAGPPRTVELGLRFGY